MPYKTIQEEHGVLTKWWGDASTSELIHMQEKVHAMRAGQPELQAQKAFNLRCPRNGKTDECCPWVFQACRPHPAFIISH